MKTIKSISLYLVQLLILILVTHAASAQVKANFSASAVSGCPIMIVNFQDNSTGNPTAWKWDLGNGTISYEKNPVGSYFNPGKYTVTLVASNANSKDSIVKTEYIVVNALPVPAFTASKTTGCFPLNVQFTDKSVASSGDIASWQWDFGDGTLSYEQNPLHMYKSAGTFTVILTVKNSKGCSQTKTEPGFIKINQGVKANFSSKTVTGCSTPVPVVFTNETVGTGSLNYQWDFGDAQTSTEPNPTNNYNPGTYTVKLIASNEFGCNDTIIKPNAIKVARIRADFSVPDKVCVGSSVQITNTSDSSNALPSSWIFSDGTTSAETNPVKIFSNTGTYDIKLVSDFGACKDFIVKTITVLDKPTVAFSATNTWGCKTPLNASFQNQSANATSYQWSFGDGGTSTQQNPIYVYTQYGTYTVTLSAKNDAGCSNTLTKTDFVKVNPVTVKSINNLGKKQCLPVTVDPVAIIADNVPIATYDWDFGDGTKSTSATPSHTYTTEGVYNLKLTITTAEGCTASYTYKEAVKAGNKPKVRFDASPRDVCAMTPVQFTDLTTQQKVDEWSWYFGDGGTSAVQSPTYVYNDTGYFNVSLIALRYGCSDTLKLDSFIHIKPPIAKFDTTFRCSDPLKRNFVDKSIGAATWSWDFGDGTASTDQNPTHAFAAAGTYAVKLTVSNGECEHKSLKKVVVIKEQGTLTLSQTETCLNTRVVLNVKNINEANISTYSWYFDGIPGNAIVTGNNPIAWSFATPGTRNIAVVLTDNLQCNDTAYTSVPLKTYGPQASFASNASKTCFGNVVSFDDLTKTDGVHRVTEYLWNYGEGSAESLTAGPFSHTYSKTGSFDVKLVVTDSYGCKDSISKPSFVSITYPTAKFTPSDTALCPSATVTFANASTGVNPNYTWDFGDGTTSTSVSPVKSYASPGTYKVKALMVDVNGCTASDSTVLKVFDAKADFSLSSAYSTCPPLTVNISNQSNNYADINWDFGDGGNSQLTNPSHVYTYPGNYTVTLLVKNNGGCTDKLTKKVVIEGPTGVFDFDQKEGCSLLNVNFNVKAQNTVKYIWDFADGNTTVSTQPKSAHTYSFSGHFLPRVVLEDGAGCQVGIKGTDSIKIHAVNPNIISDTKLLCDGGYVALTDVSTSDEPIAGYFWDFGDGTTSTLKNPKHNFSDTGFYSIKLIATTNFGCKDSTTLKNYIKVVSSPQVKMPGDTFACEPAKILLSAEFIKKDTSTVTWNWDFGNGVTSSKQFPDTVSYSTTGSYKVSVKATNSDGCTNMISRTVEIHPSPVVDAGPNVSICRFDTYQLKATGADTYTWTAHPTLNCTNCAMPSVKPDSLVTYHVVGKTLFGCSNEDSVTIGVNQPFEMIVNKGDTLCKGESVTLKASGAEGYQWIPSLWLNNASSASPTSKPDTSITYQVIGRDNAGCFKDTQSVRIKVYPIPSVEIINGDNIVVPVGGRAKLTTKNSSDVTGWKWFPSQWLSCATCSEPLAAPKDKITYSVTATNDGKCAATDQVTITLICNNANVYMPNTFSPNNDGANDVFYPRGTGLFNILTFKIFNRWGQIVFQKNGVSANDPQYGWDGTLDGAPLQPDVYVYLLEVVCSNNTVFPFKGNVSLIR